VVVAAAAEEQHTLAVGEAASAMPTPAVSPALETKGLVV